MTPNTTAPLLLSAAGITKEDVYTMARTTRFVQRSSETIPLTALLECLCQAAAEGTVSYNDLAARVQVASGVMASRQAYWQRINTDPCVAFFQALLVRIMLRKIRPEDVAYWQKCTRFKRILIQDSTIIKLPTRLFPSFSGVTNHATTVCNARIQGVYDLCAGQFISFSIDPYSHNDLLAAPQIKAQPGDLILRDRGYFLIETIGELKNKGIDTISRYKHTTTFYDLETKAEIDLLALLSRRGSVDQIVLAGKRGNIRVRLLATPVPEELANLRRMKARKQAKSYTLSTEVLQLMSWSIFIVTIKTPAITITHIMRLYRLRWRIENIFKTWKSHFSFNQLHQVSKRQLLVLLTARLIVISLSYYNAYTPLSRVIRQDYNRPLSLMKFMRYVQKNPTLLPVMLTPHNWTTCLIRSISYYCAYDKRQRHNFINHQESILNEIDALA